MVQFIHERTIVKKLTKHGNGMALVVDKPILDLLKSDTETAFELSTDAHRVLEFPAESGLGVATADSIPAGSRMPSDPTYNSTCPGETLGGWGASGGAAWLKSGPTPVPGG